MRPSLRFLRLQLEIAVLELVARALRLRLPRLRLPGRRIRLRWVATATAAVVVPAIAAVAILAQHDPAHARPAAAQPEAHSSVEPTPPAPAFGAAIFQAAAKRPAAAPTLSRLPQVDLKGLSVAGIPPAALRAYVTAARLADQQDSTCQLRWWLLAGIGLVESDHARSGGSGSPAWNGIARPAIYGPRLDGKHGYAAIRDTDHGVLDKDRTWDRAVGPMQFLPQTWQRWGGTTNGRLSDPQDIRAAALAAARYLCAGSADLSQPKGMAVAVFSYNHSFDYARLVLTVAARYAGVDPRALGVDRLPHDKPLQRNKAKRSASPQRSAAPSAAPTAPSGTTSPSPDAGSTPSSPAPAPSGAPSLPPVPEPTGTPGVGPG